MGTIDREQFRELCDAVSREIPSLVSGMTEDSQRTERVLQVLFERVCEHLELDPIRQGDSHPSAGFRLMQVLEDHMGPEFTYSNVIDEHLLLKL
jgi:hypothetical protein